MHGLINPVGWQTAMGPGGALQAFIESREKGLVRFLDVTSTAAKYRLCINKAWNALISIQLVLLPDNYRSMQNPCYATAFDELAEMCR